MSPLARALMENTTLNALNLESDPKTQETHVIDLCSLITLFTLPTDCGIGRCGVAELNRALMKNTALKRLNLCCRHKRTVKKHVSKRTTFFMSFFSKQQGTTSQVLIEHH